MLPKLGNSSISMREVMITSILQEFEGSPRFKFNNLGLAQGMVLKLYISVAKESKLKVRTFWRVIPTFLEFTVEKLVGEPFWSTHPELG